VERDHLDARSVDDLERGMEQGDRIAAARQRDRDAPAFRQRTQECFSDRGGQCLAAFGSATASTRRPARARRVVTRR